VRSERKLKKGIRQEESAKEAKVTVIAHAMQCCDRMEMRSEGGRNAQQSEDRQQAGRHDRRRRRQEWHGREERR